ncbi:hypothetical protein REPUB_Repub01dG0208100 [Reevesia pubescens]
MGNPPVLRKLFDIPTNVFLCSYEESVPYLSAYTSFVFICFPSPTNLLLTSRGFLRSTFTSQFYPVSEHKIKLKEFEFKMGFLTFLKFALICFDALAWPLFALGYPLRASIQAIEANSHSDTKKLVTYWVIFSLISLFEHAFMGMLQWLPLWPYMKLTIVCWMMIPHFDGAFYVYNHFVHPCLYMDMQTIINWLKKQKDLFLKDNFLAQADKYVQAHGPEALEKLIAAESKGTEPSILQKDIKPVQETEKMEVAPVNQIPETEPNAAQSVNNVTTLPEIKGAASFGSPEIFFGTIGSPEIPSDKQVQKEWTCAVSSNNHKFKNFDVPHKEPQKQASSTSTQASQKKQGGKKHAETKFPQFQCTICNISCGRSEDLNCHLWGKKHLARIQELNSLGRGEFA